MDLFFDCRSFILSFDGNAVFFQKKREDDGKAREQLGCFRGVNGREGREHLGNFRGVYGGETREQLGYFRGVYGGEEKTGDS